MNFYKEQMKQNPRIQLIDFKHQHFPEVSFKSINQYNSYTKKSINNFEKKNN